MDNSEFDVIKKYFTFSSHREDVVIAVGDDCAVVAVPAGKQLLVTTDTLISGVHFPVSTSAEDIAYKSLMVNLSDLAAMGATPAWVTLAITLPDIDEQWLSAFSNQFSAVLSDFDVSLIGGDTTKGALSITVQAMGLCDQEKILRRDQAKPGDKVFVTGYLGDAAIGLHAIIDDLNDEKLSACVDKLNRPEARVCFAEELVEYSQCAIDISDGLLSDLGHILTASGVGAELALEKIPLAASLACLDKKTAWEIALTGGDDYQLCFTLAEDDWPDVKAQYPNFSAIGVITAQKDLHLSAAETQGSDRQEYKISTRGYDHFG